MRLPRTTYEQRKARYGDVEGLVSVGFLSHSARVQGVRFNLRSLGPGDMFMLNARVSGAADTEWRLWTVAAAIWMIDGVSLLETPEAAPRVARTLRGLPDTVQDILFSLVLGLFVRQQRAGALTEAYCYENISRYLWRSLGGQHPMSQAGVPGVERLGANSAQQLWLAYNVVEDKRRDDEQQWEGFKLAASASAPKGIKKLNQKDQQARASEKERRQAIMDRGYYRSLGVINEKGHLSGDGAGDLGVQILGPKTDEDLEEEMRRWVTGEMDWHDEVVANYKRNIADRYEAERQAREERVQVARHVARQHGEDLTPKPLVGYSAEALQTLLRNRRQGRGGAAGVRQIITKPAGQDYLYQKYLEEDPSSGRLQETGGKLVAEAPSGTLEDQVAERTPPRYHSGPGRR